MEDFEAEYECARELAVSLWEKHYKDEAPDWQPLADLMGVITQIDNMTCGLVKEKKNASSF